MAPKAFFLTAAWSEGRIMNFMLVLVLAGLVGVLVMVGVVLAVVLLVTSKKGGGKDEPGAET